jgi:hypothetical protein
MPLGRHPAAAEAGIVAARRFFPASDGPRIESGVQRIGAAAIGLQRIGTAGKGLRQSGAQPSTPSHRDVRRHKSLDPAEALELRRRSRRRAPQGRRDRRRGARAPWRSRAGAKAVRSPCASGTPTRVPPSAHNRRNSHESPPPNPLDPQEPLFFLPIWPPPPPEALQKKGEGTSGEARALASRQAARRHPDRGAPPKRCAPHRGQLRPRVEAERDQSRAVGPRPLLGMSCCSCAWVRGVCRTCPP